MRKAEFDVNLEICQKVSAALSGVGCEELILIIQSFSKPISPKIK